MEQVEGVLCPWQLRVDHRLLRGAPELLDEGSGVFHEHERVLVAVRQEERRRVRPEVRLWRGWQPPVGVGAAVKAVQADEAVTEVSSSSNPGWKVGSLGVRAAMAARCAPAELPATNSTAGSAPYSWPCTRTQASTLLASTWASGNERPGVGDSWR